MCNDKKTIKTAFAISPLRNLGDFSSCTITGLSIPPIVQDTHARFQAE